MRAWRSENLGHWQCWPLAMLDCALANAARAEGVGMALEGEPRDAH